LKQGGQEQNRLKTGIEKIVSLINYFRLLFKIAEKVGQAGQEVFDSDIKLELSKLNSTVLKDLRQNIEMHLEILETK
jgi:hypothetical protein